MRLLSIVLLMLKKIFDCAPSRDEWIFAKDVVERLKMFNDITSVFSGTNYVIANIQLLKICEAKMKIREWSICGNPIIEEMSNRMILKFEKYWKDIQVPMGIATILDPRFKIDYLLDFFETLVGQTREACVERVHEIRDNLCDLMKEYQVDDEEDSTESSGPTLANSGLLSTISARVASRRALTMIRLKSELDRYLEEELVLISVENF
jgi:hypothetical protein